MSLVFSGVSVLTALYLLWLYIKAWKSPLHAIPTIGYSGVLTSYITAIKYVFYAEKLIQEGYDKYRGKAFKVATIRRWLVLVSGSQMVDDVRKAKDEQLSSRIGTNEIIAADILLGPQVLHDNYHAEVVRTQVTRNLAVRFSEIKDEIAASFSNLIPASEDDWTEVVAYKTILHAVVRTSNRLFIGLPLCRNRDYIELQQEFTVDLFKISYILYFFPTFLRPFIARFINVKSQIRRAIKLLGPLIEDRIAKVDELGPHYAEKPNDVISWCLEYAKDEQRTTSELTIRILVLNLGAIHTTSMTFTHILYDLAVHPEFVPAMREEVETTINEHGWSKASMGKMRKLDSFVKESIRLSGAGAFTMLQKVVRDFTFSNGQVVPAGTSIGVTAHFMHLDDDLYPSGHKFDGFRFVKMNGEDENDAKHQVVSLCLDYIAFGHGRHACPGRFFVANEMKAMLAYVLLNYDVKLRTDQRPPNLWFEDKQIPNINAKVMFKKRKCIPHLVESP